MGRAGPTLIAVLLAAVPAAAAVEVVLKDGRVLSGDTLELRGDLFLLDQGGGTMALPAGLVRELRFSGAPDPATGEPPEEDRGNPIVVGRAPPPAPPRELTEDPEDPDPRRPTGRTPPSDEQIAAFRLPPSRLVKSPLDPWWRPEDRLGYKTDRARFNPVRWYRAPTDPTWTPTSGFRDVSPEPGFSPVRWYRPAIRSTWFPRDAFGPRRWFPPVASSRPATEGEPQPEE